MGIDVLNHMWVGVFSAYFVQQHAEETKRIGCPGTALMENSDRFAEEAASMADEALEAYRRVTARETAEAIAKSRDRGHEGAVR